MLLLGEQFGVVNERFELVLFHRRRLALKGKWELKHAKLERVNANDKQRFVVSPERILLERIYQSKFLIGLLDTAV
ncbi:MAG: hypothetical protein Aurels2KO_31610 [Aureliella sp.]